MGELYPARSSRQCHTTAPVSLSYATIALALGPPGVVITRLPSTSGEKATPHLGRCAMNSAAKSWPYGPSGLLALASSQCHWPFTPTVKRRALTQPRQLTLT